MPYTIRKVNHGYQVFKAHGRKPFSSKPLTEKKAKAQRTAIILSELRKKGKL